MFVLGKLKNERQMSILCSFVLKWNSLKRQCLSQVRSKLCVCVSAEVCRRYGMCCVFVEVCGRYGMCCVSVEVCGRYGMCCVSAEVCSKLGMYYIRVCV